MEIFDDTDIGKEVINTSPCSAHFTSGSACRRMERVPARRRRSRRGWTKEEDSLLPESVRRFHGRQWRKIAECLPGRTVSQCFCRWKRVLDPVGLKEVWTKEEGNRIMGVVEPDCSYGFETDTLELAFDVLNKEKHQAEPENCVINVQRSLPWTKEFHCVDTNAVIQSNISKGNCLQSKLPDTTLNLSCVLPAPTSSCSPVETAVPFKSVSALSLRSLASFEPNSSLLSLSNTLDPVDYSMQEKLIQRSSSCVCPESILRNAARTFKNIPSIIRKKPSV